MKGRWKIACCVFTWASGWRAFSSDDSMIFAFFTGLMSVLPITKCDFSSFWLFAVLCDCIARNCFSKWPETGLTFITFVCRKLLGKLEPIKNFCWFWVDVIWTEFPSALPIIFRLSCAEYVFTVLTVTFFNNWMFVRFTKSFRSTRFCVDGWICVELVELLILSQNSFDWYLTPMYFETTFITLLLCCKKCVRNVFNWPSVFGKIMPQALHFTFFIANCNNNGLLHVVDGAGAAWILVSGKSIILRIGNFGWILVGWPSNIWNTEREIECNKFRHMRLQ